MTQRFAVGELWALTAPARCPPQFGPHQAGSGTVDVGLNSPRSSPSLPSRSYSPCHTSAATPILSCGLLRCGQTASQAHPRPLSSGPPPTADHLQAWMQQSMREHLALAGCVPARRSTSPASKSRSHRRTAIWCWSNRDKVVARSGAWYSIHSERPMAAFNNRWSSSTGLTDSTVRFRFGSVTE